MSANWRAQARRYKTELPHHSTFPALDRTAQGKPIWIHMRLSPISIACPQCGARDVFYSCKPECCFNHVCNSCYTTFELETMRVGETADLFEIPPEPDSTNPTAPCSRCKDSKVFEIADPPSTPAQYLCVSCKAILKLEITSVEKG